METRLTRVLLLAATVLAVVAGVNVAAAVGLRPAYLTYVSVYFIGAAGLVSGALGLGSRPQRSALLCQSAALILAGWAVITGYGTAGALGHPAGILALIGAVACLRLLSGSARRLAAGALVIGSGLLALIALSPYALPNALLWIYAVMAEGAALLFVLLLPGRASHSRLAVAVVSIVGWIIGVATLLLAFGPPLANA